MKIISNTEYASELHSPLHVTQVPNKEGLFVPQGRLHFLYSPKTSTIGVCKPPAPKKDSITRWCTSRFAVT